MEALCALKRLPAEKRKLALDFSVWQRAEISLRQRHTQTAGGGSRFARACNVHKENGRKSLNEGCPGILKPTQLSSLHIYEAELLEGSGRG